MLSTARQECGTGTLLAILVAPLCESIATSFASPDESCFMLLSPGERVPLQHDNFNAVDRMRATIDQAASPTTKRPGMNSDGDHCSTAHK